MEKAFAIDALLRWYKANAGLLAKFETRIKLPEQKGHGAAIEIESPSRRMGVCAWNQGNALEITVADSEETYIEDGPCADEAEFDARLDAFLQKHLGSDD
mgnify:CR=1 FL=1